MAQFKVCIVFEQLFRMQLKPRCTYIKTILRLGFFSNRCQAFCHFGLKHSQFNPCCYYLSSGGFSSLEAQGKRRHEAVCSCCFEPFLNSNLAKKVLYVTSSLVPFLDGTNFQNLDVWNFIWIKRKPNHLINLFCVYNNISVILCVRQPCFWQGINKAIHLFVLHSNKAFQCSADISCFFTLAASIDSWRKIFSLELIF